MDSAAFVSPGLNAGNSGAGLSGKNRTEPARRNLCNHLTYIAFLPETSAR
jgi:hypothetical protein